MIIDDLTLIKPLGKSALGEVYLAQKENANNRLAVKRIDKRFFGNKKAKNYIDNNIEFLKKADNPAILKLIGTKETKNYYYIFL